MRTTRYDGMVADAASLDPPLTLISREEVAELEGGELDKQFCEGAAHLGFHHHMQKSQEWIVRLFLKYTATLSDDAKIQEVQESATGAFGLELLVSPTPNSPSLLGALPFSIGSEILVPSPLSPMHHHHHSHTGACTRACTHAHSATHAHTHTRVCARTP